jgi:DNA-binding beta-propeller fold protein YncE
MNMTMARVGAALLAVSSITACGAHERGGRADDGVARWTLQRVATIDPDSAGLNASIRSIAADGDGNVYVAGYGAGGIYVFDSTGRSVRVLGRAGSGPGEFKNRYSLAWAGDTLAVYDPENGRVELVDRMGNWVASEPSLRITGGSDVRLYQSGRRAFFRPSYQKVAGSDGIRSTLIRSGLGVAPDTLILPEDNAGQPFTLICRSDKGIGFESSRYAPQSRTAVSPDGDLITWRTDQYRLTFTRNDSQAFRVISYDQLPIPLTDSMWALDLADYEKWRKQWSGADCDAGSLRKPETVWLLNAVEFDDQRRVWVEGMQHDSMMLAVYDTAGRQIASMPAPERDLDVPYVVRGDRLYEVEVDEDGLQKVVVYRFAR